MSIRSLRIALDESMRLGLIHYPAGSEEVAVDLRAEP